MSDHRSERQHPFDAIRAVADAVLYEGYVLYPYRASSQKNQLRWQFGVLMPPAYTTIDSSERSFNQTQCLLECSDAATLTVAVRFLQVQDRTGPADAAVPRWSEAVERQVDSAIAVAELLASSVTVPFSFPAERSITEDVERQTVGLSGRVALSMTTLGGPYRVHQLTCRVENITDSPTHTDRDQAVRYALVSAHSMCAIDPGRFLSATDPPEWASRAVAECTNIGTWPVLAGDDDVLLSSPIILADHPEIAPESPGSLYDSTEIDEILTLRTLALTDEEKREARETDPRAAAVIDQVEGLSAEHLDRLHGAIRYLRAVTGAQPAQDERLPWWDPGADTSVSPETDTIAISGVPIGHGSRVRLRPGSRRADAQDLFLVGRTATVEAVFHDVDGNQHVGVTPDDDADSAQLQRWHGRFLYFAPEEIEPLEAPR